MPPLTLPEAISLLSAMTALVAVIVGPIVTWKIAKRQIKASVISTNRQKWIGDLRDNIAGFMTSAKIANVEDALDSSRFSAFAADPDSHNEAMKALALFNNKVVLLVNPQEPDHMKLLKLMAEMIEFCSSGNPNDHERLNHLQDNITSTSQQILKREWGRVKSGE